VLQKPYDAPQMLRVIGGRAAPPTS
jgi:hypothetical protein